MKQHLLLLWFTVALPCSALARDLIHAETGELPIILTAPHGGRQDVPGCEPRTPTGSRFVTNPDYNTDILAQSIAAEIKRLTGKPPYLVIARFHRKFIDANRRADEAYGTDGCKADYALYHAAIRRQIDKLAYEVSRDALALVDAFAIPDQCLAAPIGMKAESK